MTVCIYECMYKIPNIVLELVARIMLFKSMKQPELKFTYVVSVYEYIVRSLCIRMHGMDHKFSSSTAVHCGLQYDD